MVFMRIAMGLIVLAVIGSTAPAQAEQRVAAASQASQTGPGVFVTLASAAIDDTERTGHVDAIRKTLSASSILENKRVDVSVTRFSVNHVGNVVEIQAETCFILSTSGDQIVSFANQTAKLVLPKSQFHPTKLPALRREVIDTAMGDLLRKLRRWSAARAA